MKAAGRIGTGLLFSQSPRLVRRIFLATLLIGSLAQFSIAFPLVDQARSNWKIAIVSKDNPTVAFAADELAKYIKQISNYSLPPTDLTPSTPTIELALRADLPKSDRDLLPPPAPGFDGYSIAILDAANDHPAKIILAGDNPRGVVYAAYDLLEHLGCRWFYPTQNAADPEVVPHRETLSIDPGTWSVASPIKNRICSGSSWVFDVDPVAAKKQLDWAMKNRYNAIGWGGGNTSPLLDQFAALRKAGLLDDLTRRGMFLYGPGHSFNMFLPAEQYFAAHPDWFGMRDGKRVPQTFLGAQFCWSNADARKQFAENVEKFALSSPEIGILCIAPFDGGLACTCDECKKIGSSNALMLLMRDVSDRLARSAPNVTLETLGGYAPMQQPPTKVPAPENLRIIWAHWGRNQAFGYDDPRYDKSNLDAWRKAAKGGLTICQYYTDNFAEPWVMPVFAPAIVGDRKYFLSNKVDGLYMLMWSSGFWWTHSLNGYIAGRCFYDTTLDPYPLIDDYATNYFGPKAGPLLSKYFTQWAKESDLAYRVRDGALPADWKLLAAQRRDYIDPAVAATAGDPVLAARVSRVEKLHALAERLCEVHRRRYEIQFLRERGDFAQAKQKLDDARLYAESALYWFYALADMDQGLIERKDIGFLIKIRVRDWVDAEAKAIADKSRKVERYGDQKALKETDVLPGVFISSPANTASNPAQ